MSKEAIKVLAFDNLGDRANQTSLHSVAKLVEEMTGAEEVRVESRSLEPLVRNRPSGAENRDTATDPTEPGRFIGNEHPIPTGMTVVHACGVKTDKLDLDRLVDEFDWLTAYEVNESVHLQADDHPDHPVMRLGLLVARSGMTREQFATHWNERHAPLVLASGPKFYQYATNIPQGPSPFDGAVEQWYVNQEAWDEHDRLNANSKPEIKADIPRFRGYSQTFVAKVTDAISECPLP